MHLLVYCNRKFTIIGIRLESQQRSTYIYIIHNLYFFCISLCVFRFRFSVIIYSLYHVTIIKCSEFTKTRSTNSEMSVHLFDLYIYYILDAIQYKTRFLILGMCCAARKCTHVVYV